MEGEYALKWTRLSCMRFTANAVRLQLRALAYNLANLLRTLATTDTACGSCAGPTLAVVDRHGGVKWGFSA